VLVVESVFDREETRRGRPNATDSDGRERDASAAATRDGGGGGGGTAMVGPVNSSPWQINKKQQHNDVRRDAMQTD
jgi:hypothetical protein